MVWIWAAVVSTSVETTCYGSVSCIKSQVAKQPDQTPTAPPLAGPSHASPDSARTDDTGFTFDGSGETKPNTLCQARLLKKTCTNKRLGQFPMSMLHMGQLLPCCQFAICTTVQSASPNGRNGSRSHSTSSGTKKVTPASASPASELLPAQMQLLNPRTSRHE
jgi:hypothetical protein